MVVGEMLIKELDVFIEVNVYACCRCSFVYCKVCCLAKIELLIILEIIKFSGHCNTNPCYYFVLCKTNFIRAILCTTIGADLQSNSDSVMLPIISVKACTGLAT